MTETTFPMALKPVILITGGSEGIGLYLAHEFAALEKTLVLVARNEDKLKAAAGEIRKRRAVEVHILPLDLTAQDSTAQIISWLTQHHYYVDILVNNAGMGVVGPFAKSDPAKIMKMVNLNLRACTELMMAFLPGMVERDTGGVLNVASLAGCGPFPYFSAYAATKAYLVTLSTSVFDEVRWTGVKMSVLAPGPVDTPFHTHIDEPVSGILKRLLFKSPQSVALAGFNGFLRGKRMIVPGFLPLLSLLAMKIIPRRSIGFFMGVIVRLFAKEKT